MPKLMPPALTFAGIALVGCTLFAPKPAPAQPASAHVEVRSTTTVQSDNGGIADSELEGLTLRQRDYARRLQRSFQAKIDQLRDRCGWAPDAKIVWRSFAQEMDLQLDGGRSNSIHGYCAAPLETVMRYCRDGNTDGFNAAAQRFDSYRCHFGGEGRWSMQFQGNQLVHHVDWSVGTSNVDNWLGRNL